MQLSQIIRRSPIIYRLLFPFWMRYHKQLFQARNLLMLNSPILLKAGGRVWRFHPHGQILESLFWGRFERAEIDFVLNFLKPEMCVVDAGANIGLYSVLAATMVAPGGEVHAFEPSVKTYGLLKKNLQLNRSENVVRNQMALSDSEEDMVMRMDHQYPNYDAHWFVEKIEPSQKLSEKDNIVQSKSLDNYLLEKKVRQVNFLKVDVEGAELLVLKGALSLLENASDLTLMLECTQHEFEVFKLLVGYGFKFFRWDMIERRLLPVDFYSTIKTSNVIARRNRWID